MGELRLTGLDEEVLAQLSRRAAAHGRSAEEEASAILGAAILRLSLEKEISMDEWLTLAAESRRLSGHLSVNSLDMLHEGRDERLADL